MKSDDRELDVCDQAPDIGYRTSGVGRDLTFIKYILNILESSKGLNLMFPPSTDGMS